MSYSMNVELGRVRRSRFRMARTFHLERIQNRADIDISGPESNFVRSIRVFGVALVHQDESGPAGDEECERSARIYLGSYPIQACENADVIDQLKYAAPHLQILTHRLHQAVAT